MMRRLIAYSPPYGENYLADLETAEFMHRCGIDVVKLILSNSFSRLGIPYSPYPPLWTGPDEYHFDVAERQITDLTQRNPSVRFIVTVDLNSPPFLRELVGADSFKELGECWLDPVWRKCTADYQAALMTFLESRYADRIAGWYVACGKTQEWFDPALEAVTPRRAEHYAKWCAKNGRTPLELPEPGEFENAPGPVLPPHLVQWREYGNALVSECAAYFFRRTRELAKVGQVIGGVFANIHDLGHKGHLLAERFCREARPDFYIGPSCNSEGAMGGASGFQSAQLMLERFGIGYLHSCDRQLSTTAIEIGPGVRSDGSNHPRQVDAAADVACLKREFALALVHGFSLWFFNIWGFAYRGKMVRETLRDCGEIWKNYAHLSTGTDAETLLVFDPASDLRRPASVKVMGRDLRTKLLPEAGIPFTTATLGDLAEVDLSPYKLIVFQYCDRLADAAVQRWCRELCAGGRVVLQSSDDRSAAALRNAGELAGIHFFTADADLKVWSSREFLSAHTRNGGTKTIKLKRRVRRVVELFSRRVVAEDAECFSDEFSAPDTHLYFLEP